MQYIKIFLITSLTLIWSNLSVASDISQYLGVWQTIDDETQKTRSHILLSVEEDELKAVIIKTFNRQGIEVTNDPICTQCKGDLKNQKITGLNILFNMRYNDGLWESGQILDPDNGKKYDAKIWLENNKLHVRGYIGFFFRTQKWIRLKEMSNSVN